MQPVLNACLSVAGAWPIAAIALLFGGFVLNRRVKSQWLQSISMTGIGSTVSVRRDANAPITSTVTTNHTSVRVPAAPSPASATTGLSTVADVLQVVGFVILMLQLFKILPGA